VSLPPLPDAFGNYALVGFHDIVAPAAISWLPQTPGWWLVAATFGVLLARWTGRKLRHWYRNRYRGEALRRLQSIEDIADECFIGELNKLLKITALTAYSRPEVARLTGSAWVEFLNTRCDTQFANEQAAALATGSYMPQTLSQPTRDALLEASRRWILQHRVSEHD
jgi:hypothetical protein